MTKSEFKDCDAYAVRIAALRPFPPETLKSLRDYYRVGLTYTSNALEGNSLTESETKVVIEDGLTIGGKPLRDVYEATGHARAYDRIYSLVEKRPVSLEDILDLHRLFYSEIDGAQAGRWRTVRVFISGSRRVLPASEKVPSLMKAFVEWMSKAEETLHPVEFAALVHQKFVYIHPFVDGNGRMARLLMNLALLRAGWTLAIIPPICRSEYIATLEGAGRSPAAFVRFIRDRVCETQKELLRLMGESIVLGDDGLNPKNDDGINEGIKTLCEIIAQNPGRRTTDLAGLLGKSVPTVERYVKALKDRGEVEFRGSKKTGGYWRVG
jgi:Fic family protein